MVERGVEDALAGQRYPLTMLAHLSPALLRKP